MNPITFTNESDIYALSGALQDRLKNLAEMEKTNPRLFGPSVQRARKLLKRIETEALAAGEPNSDTVAKAVAGTGITLTAEVIRSPIAFGTLIHADEIDAIKEALIKLVFEDFETETAPEIRKTAGKTLKRVWNAKIVTKACNIPGITVDAGAGEDGTI